MLATRSTARAAPSLSSSARTTYICQSCRRFLQRQSPRSTPQWTIPQDGDSTTPFRKRLKDEEKARKADRSKHQAPSRDSKNSSASPDKWELTIGLEIHAELNTARKLFSSASTSVNAPQNTHVALFDAAFPGSQPQFQAATLLPAVRAALALRCEVQRRSSWDRKHYFYMDQPCGYQITQYYEPFARNGSITLTPADGIDPADGEMVTIGIKQVQMEQDTAKTLVVPPAGYLLDFNRVSHPLIEIITLPQIHSPITAAACVRKIQAILHSVNAVTAGMELGGLRADVNVSVRPRGEVGEQEYAGVTGLGQRTEIKNLASLKAVEDAIIAERDRQIGILEAGGTVEGETRGWTLGAKETTRLRGKEGEVDYRYMPDPDLSPLLIGEDLIEHLRSTLPLLPDDTEALLIREYGLSSLDAKTLLSLDEGDRLEYYMEVVSILREALDVSHGQYGKLGKTAGNWVLHELGGLLSTQSTPFAADLVPAPQLAAIILHLTRKEITGRTAKLLLSVIFAGDERGVEDIIQAEGLLLRPLSEEEYRDLAQTLVDENPKLAAAVRSGQKGKVMWFVGQMMRAAEGRVEARKAEEVLRQILE